MAFAFNPFSEEGRSKRLSGPQPYSQFPAGASVNPAAVPVANPTPETQAVESLPNQLNVDEGVAYPINEAFLNWYQERDDAGLGFLDVPAPYMTAQTERVQEGENAGDYIGYGFEADWSGVPEPVRDMQQLYMEPIVGRLNRSVADTNAERARVREVMQPQTYQTERAVQNVDPLTGRSYTTFVPQTAYQPFFPVESLYL